ncbi:MAG: chromosome segregation protein SMC [Candidatus Scalindua sp. AMX11]|nr:MAG: chromosome segregation protein SMC [Candidatus Scalindua sp.]NOG83838.1 chromosome segregation protein SMC [Planctomycetota bacterium]RZV82989.1 MAG: chromosome segregation protein SMC [Candidatus Scalindua sp. SCAELEC01]TDE64492.1 MAG: chromosome segregation protein SMC [Candidatus Scalindua sp. AMX11]GJQ58767.1 MAG: chromosome partition protein Smc [Candidatus Scalindua sp.]
MKMKKLEFFGFKSFSDRTTFIFETGITVVVGPNGCGKSNVVDAIKWILGEQSAKSLRGNEMSDVIFNGSTKRSSMGYAEASLTILNDREVLPVEYKEVCITRRLYASGESEYLLNKQVCRLKDIKELFMDTGVGASCYSIIEQGRVDTLLQANAQERRFVFEEAAGISKYKSKKKETIVKLGKVEQNLLRLSDIIEEVQKQLRSVKYQASKARKYNEYNDRLKELRLKFFLRKYKVFHAEMFVVIEQIDQLENKGQEGNAEIDNLQEKRDGLQRSLDLFVSDLEKSQINLANIDAKIINTDDRINFNKKTIEDLNTQKSRHEKQIEILKSKILGAESGISKFIADLKEITDDILQKNSSLSLKESEFEQYLFECDALQQKIEENKENVIDILHKESVLQNETGSRRAERDTILHRRVKLLQRQETVSSEIERIESERRVLAEQRDEILQSIESFESRSSRIQERLQGVHIQIETINDTINTKQQFRSSKESRLEILEDLEIRYEGIGIGVKSILEEGKKEDSEITGICGMVADLIRVEKSYVSAIEAVLGDSAQIIVTESVKDAIQAIDFLKERGKGYAKFLPLDHIKEAKTALASGQDFSGFLGNAVDLVKAQEHFSPLVEYFFHNVIIVEDFETALSHANNGNGVRFIATRAGEVVQPGGTILVGSSDMQIGLISRKMELESVHSELEKVKNDIEHCVRQKEVRTQERESLAQELNEVTQEIDSKNMLKVSHENDLQKREFKAVELRDEQEINESEIYEINEQVESINEKEEKLSDEIRMLNDQRKDLESQVVISDSAKGEKESLKSQLQEELTEIKVVIAQKEERRENISMSLKKLEGELQGSREELASSYHEVEACSGKVTEGEEEIVRYNTVIEGLRSEKVSLENSIKDLRIKQNECVEQLTDTNRQIEEYSKEQKNQELEINELRMKENEYKIKISGLEERIREDYHVELSQFKTENQEEDDESIDWNSVSLEIDQLKGKVERMGSVNLEAIQELEELENREAHLLNQREDLETSENTLKEIIKKINLTSRELFEKTFHDIKNNFRVIFRKLFGGGKADIILEEGVDILDAGIEIVAQPPGKELSSITLFSGGEKVMTTIALLFAIFQSKPSPFCILDEVDAALDENNINRFAMILKEFTSLSDFLVITHNKRTMSVADVIYGITMEEAGVSKKISVKFKEDVKQVA